MRAGALVADPDEEGASPYLNLERPDDDALALLESAAVRGETRCALCEGALDAEAEIVAFPAFLPRSHRLSPYSNAAFHRSCYLGWGERQRFGELYTTWQAVWSQRPAIPEGVSWSEFERSSEYREFLARLDREMRVAGER